MAPLGRGEPCDFRVVLLRPEAWCHGDEWREPALQRSDWRPSSRLPDEKSPVRGAGQYGVALLGQLGQKFPRLSVLIKRLTAPLLALLERIECEVADYSLLARPAWVDLMVDRLKEVAEERTRLLVLEQRTRILEQQVKRVTQRVNLFDKILIPTAKKNIQKIQIYLADAERAAVVRSKITKRMRQRLAAEE